MNDAPQEPVVLRVANLPERKPYRFALTPAAEHCEKIASDLDLLALRKLSFTGTIRAEGRQNWRLEATLGATVVQPCVLTLAPVTTRIDTPVLRRFVKNWDVPSDVDELEMPEDDTTEPLTPEINLMAVLSEALALALPDYPKAPDAVLAETSVAPEGVTPMTDDEAKPFAALAGLKEKLEKPDG